MRWLLGFNMRGSMLRDLDRLVSPPIGVCIYCGSSESLRREHIVPFGLSGTAVLQQASCAACERVTSRFEREVLRGPMWPVRVVRRLKSRRPGEALARERLKMEIGGELIDLDLPLNDFPVLLPMPLFERPTALGGPAVESGILVRGVHTIRFGPTPEEVARKHGATRIILTREDRSVAFARMLAKIAYGYAVSQLGIGAFARVFVRDAILGVRDDVGKWVGTKQDVGPVNPLLLHRLALSRRADDVIVEVHLFADSQTPSYDVVVGRLNSNILAG